MYKTSTICEWLCITVYLNPSLAGKIKKYGRIKMLKPKSNCIKDGNPIEPIISRSLFDKSNRILDARAFSQKGKSKYSSRYPLSGKIKCGRCGASYVARYKTRKDGSRYKAWRCGQAARNGRFHLDEAGNPVGCSGMSIRNEEAVDILAMVFKLIPFEREKLSERVIQLVSKVISEDGADVGTLEAIKKAVDELLVGIRREEAFYGRLLERMAVNDRNHVDVYLYALPFKWSCTVAKAPVL